MKKWLLYHAPRGREDLLLSFCRVKHTLCMFSKVCTAAKNQVNFMGEGTHTNSVFNRDVTSYVSASLDHSVFRNGQAKVLSCWVVGTELSADKDEMN